MATRIIKVSDLKGGSYTPQGTIGNHCLVYYPESHKILGFHQDYLVDILDGVTKDDVIIYDCGHLKVMCPWRKRVYNLIGYMPVIITRDIPQTHNEGDTCTHEYRSARGEFYRRMNKDICLCVKGRSHELFSYDTGYVARIYARTPKALLKFLGKRANIDWVTQRYYPLNTL